MLYDDPTTGLDPQMTRNIITIINHLAEVKRVTSIVVTHQISDALELADKFIIIDSGTVAFDGTMIQLVESKDPKVMEFLEPFRDAIANVRKIDFI
jgi:ABC-type transporter Mla maintaining outer membrane lipid asymmetry ATPase subunit MlaF